MESSLNSTARITLQAVTLQEAAVQAVNLHAQKLKEAMDNSEVHMFYIYYMLHFCKLGLGLSFVQCF